MGGENFFNRIAESFIVTLTTSINFYSGILQLSIYFLIFITFAFALLKVHHALQVLIYCNFEKIKSQVGVSDLTSNPKTPLAVISANVFTKAKTHYLKEKKNSIPNRAVPPDAFVRDDA